MNTFILFLAALGITTKTTGPTFYKDVLPVLRAHCFECHGGREKVQGGFQLTSRAGLLKGGELGPAVSPLPGGLQSARTGVQRPTFHLDPRVVNSMID